MIIALVVPGFAAGGGRVVTRAKKDMSALMRGQGMLPLRPMPSRGCVCVGVRTGVVATMRVRGGGSVWEGILGGLNMCCFFFWIVLGLDGVFWVELDWRR